MPFTFVDLFSSVGAFHYGAKRQGGTCKLMCEVDPERVDVYIRNHPGKYAVANDIRTLRDLPPHDLLLAGPPCQSYSTAGKRKGTKDPRGQLGFDLLRLIKKSMPKAVVIENVLGMMSDPFFGTIIKSLDEWGYFVNVFTLNAADFGCVQSRRRVFIVGTIRFVLGAPQPFPECDRDSAIKDIMRPDHGQDWLDTKLFRIFPPSKQIEMEGSGYVLAGQVRHVNRDIPDAVFGKPSSAASYKKGMRVFHERGRLPTLTGSDAGRVYVWVARRKGVRLLSPSEVYATLGFPTTFRPHAMASKAYLHARDTVAVPVVEAVVKWLKQQRAI